MKTDDVNINLIKAYVTKHAKLYKIYPLVIISRKLHKRNFAFYMYATQEELSKWDMCEHLRKLFSVDMNVVNKVLNQMAAAEAANILKRQIKIPYTGYFKKTKNK